MSLVAAASRVLLASLAGGAGYASVRAGVWSDGKTSKEKLDTMRDQLREEIYYPPATKNEVSKVAC